jgi:protein-arginine kinase activator protein McsA
MCVDNVQQTIKSYCYVCRQCAADHKIALLRLWTTVQHTYQALVFKRVVNTSNQQPERPQVLKAELQNEVCHQN